MPSVMYYRLMNILVFNSIFYTVSAQFEPLKEKPEKCYGTFEVMDRHCCILPPFFSRDVARECGAMTSLTDLNKEHNVTTLQRQIINECEHWQCVLTKYGILDSEDRVSLDKYYTHLDKWVSLNKEFSTVMATARLHCREEFRFHMPLDVCEFFEFQQCIRYAIIVNCPNVVQTPECFEWKTFYEECREYFM